MSPQPLLDMAVSALNGGNFAEVEWLCRQILDSQPDAADAMHLMGIAQASLGKLDSALASFCAALKHQPDNVDLLGNRGNILQELRRHDEALESYEQVFRLDPNNADAPYNHAKALQALQRYDEALNSYERALTLRPADVEALVNRGAVLQALERDHEALASFDMALFVAPHHAEAHYNRGNVLRELERPDEAVAAYDRAIAARPEFPAALSNRGAALQNLQRYDEALSSYSRAVALRPDHADTLFNCANALLALGRNDEAAAYYDRALDLRPNDATALGNRGNALAALKRYEAARDSYEAALIADPRHAHAFGGAAGCVLAVCDWERRARYASSLGPQVFGGSAVIPPFEVLAYSDDPAMHLRAATRFLADEIPDRPPPLCAGKHPRRGKIRIGYLSADFRVHPTSHLIAELFERHDRSRFEVAALSLGPDDASAVRRRIAGAVDAFHDLSAMSDEEAARFIHERRIDIVVDLMGYIHNSRPGILAWRPAPVQVSYLGYPGPMGADFIDYVIADPVVLPLEDQQFYTEQIVHLPDCYQVNDTRRAIAARTPSRAEAGLPEQEFVFCCFNNNWKITPDLFDIWMRLLRATPGSVLWLLSDNPVAEHNLRREARARSVNPGRLVFAGRLPLEDHLARHRLANLFLDTLPYNAHTTASDALWTGLPVVTCKGNAFAGRVAASLLQAAGLPELITADLAAYEALALKLASDPAALSEIKAKLAAGRDTCPLFDIARFTRNIEAAYEAM